MTFLKQTIAESVGDWYFNREVSKEIDCPYPLAITWTSHEVYETHLQYVYIYIFKISNFKITLVDIETQYVESDICS